VGNSILNPVIHINALGQLVSLLTRHRLSVLIYEDNLRLRYPDTLHEEIWTLGAGRYSFWNDWVYFLSSDNSDPTINGRCYHLRWGIGKADQYDINKGKGQTILYVGAKL